MTSDHTPNKPSIVMVDDRSLPAELASGDFIILEFSKKKVLARDIAEAHTSLLHIIDHPETTLRFKQGVSFYFAGWDHDKREVFEIPECVDFFKKLTLAWPYWAHFMELQSETAILAMALLSSAVPVRKKHSKLKPVAAINTEFFPVVFDQLQNGCRQLYQHLGLTDTQAQVAWEQFVCRINDAIEVKFDE